MTCFFCIHPMSNLCWIGHMHGEHTSINSIGGDWCLNLWLLDHKAQTLTTTSSCDHFCSWFNLIYLQLMQTPMRLVAAVVTVVIALEAVIVIAVLLVVVQKVALSVMGVWALAVAALLALHLLVVIIEIPLTQRVTEQWRGDIMMTMNLLRQIQKGDATTHLQCKKYFLTPYLDF